MMFVRSAIIAVVRYDNNARWHVVQGNYIRNWVGRLLMTFAGKLSGETREKKRDNMKEIDSREREIVIFH